jgi:hypothetical protein
MTQIHASLSGFTRWDVLDEHGQAVQSGAHSNLILNTGLNSFASEANGSNIYYSGLDEQRPFGAFRAVLHVGTGTGAPAVTDTTLTNRVTGTQTGGFQAEQSKTYSQVGGVLSQISRQVRVVDIVAAANLTEYGLGPSTTALSIRELFRDGSGNPVAVSVQPGYQVKVTHDLTVSLPFAAAAGVLNLGAGNMNTLSTFYAGGARAATDLYDLAFMVFAPSNSITLCPITAADAGSPGVEPARNALFQAGVVQPYTAGSYARTKRHIIAPASANFLHYGWIFLNSGGYTDAGFKVALQGASVNKTSTQRLTLDLAVSWARV